MSKFRYTALIAIFLFLCLIFFRNCLLYQPLLNHVEKRFEKKWDCEVDVKSADCNLLKGLLTFKDAHLGTPANADSRWALDAGEIFIQIDYSSLFSANLVLEELILERLIFRHEKFDGNDFKREHVPPVMSTRQNGRESGKETVKRKGAFVKHLLIRNGRFDFNFLSGSGKEKRIKIEQVSLSKRDVFLGHEPDFFFRSLLEPLGYFAFSQ